MTISAPSSKGRQSIGVGKVLSTTKGIPLRCASFEKRSKSSTSSAGFAIVSPKNIRVFSSIFFSISSSDIDAVTNLTSIPKRLSVTENRFTVPPDIEARETMFCPALVILSTARRIEDIPDEQSIAPVPPSRSAIFFSTSATVGFEILEYICPSALRSKRSPTSSDELYL